MRLRPVQRSAQRAAPRTPLQGRFGATYPADSILHWDADIDGYSEQTGGVHTFNHNVLGPQFQLTATSYPVPYVPPGVTQPASNATTTNGSWFSLPDGSELWKSLTGQPLTLATRVRMGVGSGDLPSGTSGAVVSVSTTGSPTVYFQRGGSGTGYTVITGDGVSFAQIAAEWPRNAVIIRVTQVNTTGTQFRVGYMIEGTHTAIQWGSWVAFDGSFGPSTLYRLLLGYDNAYPMWFNKITAWKKQATDAEILEAMAA